jgi:nucleoside-diphosphate-sugar epimerase
MKILVTGATGALGPCIVKRLLMEGYSVRTFSLDPPPEEFIGGAVEIVNGNITDFDAVASAMKGVDAVIHMAALLHIVDPPEHMRKRYEEINVGGTVNVVKASILSNVRRIIFFSTIAVYGDTKGEILSENSVPKPETFYARTKLSAEKVILDAVSSDGQPIGIVLRNAAVFGANMKGNYNKLLSAVSSGRFIPVGKGVNRRTMIYDKDIAEAVMLALNQEKAFGKVYNVTDGGFHTINEIIESMCKALQKRTPKFSLPEKPFRLLASAIEDVFKLVGLGPPITRSTIDKYTEDMAVNGDLIHSELGFTPLYTLDKGMKEIVEELNKRK